MTTAIFLQAAAVAGGAAVGALARWGTGLWLNASYAGFPLGTLAVNLVGGFLIGMAMAWFGRSPNDLLKLLLVTGFLGGLTTFSAFSAESLSLLQRGHYGLLLTHAGAHMLGGLACAAIGMRLLRA
ncbi:fluoride efflux transporter CrcB [Paucibacter sp. B2R-40]|uniref:fluoride efflux transporter CrcB n=1 Tax=Paucibacter sp. B2R-40 TaxID=2893554 RepID=UPI0021E42B1B|nr:fluoride efflux transporter CrcB [Paucibacter sp. B2R-40]MCV2355284.1 fluoride efflux transporter CrcB [Paucibacter sp. B2R-40]